MNSEERRKMIAAWEEDQPEEVAEPAKTEEAANEAPTQQPVATEQ